MYEFHQENRYPIHLLCTILGVSRSGYYKWGHHVPSTREIDHQRLMERIKKMFYKYKGIFGYRRITHYLNKENEQKGIEARYERKQIRRLMLKMGLKSHIRRSKGYCTKTSYVNIEENILNRQFKADKPNQKWVTDITYLQYGKGQKVYLSALKDLYDGTVIAYKISKNNDYALVMETLKEALKQNPKATPILHSDRGSQYTSKQYRQITTEAGITRSMSRVGKCIDNAPMKSFFGHYKCESYHLKEYTLYQELIKDIDEYMEFYNFERLQETKNNLTPMEFRYQVAI